MLSQSDCDRVTKIVLERIGSSGLVAPLQVEREPAYTARALMPRARAAAQDLQITGLTITGDGAASAPIIALPSCEFRPDIALLYERSRVAAVEVKFLRSSGRQYSLAAAIGQAVVYRSHGYRSVAVILLDLAPVPGEAKAIHDVLRGLALSGLIYQKAGSKLLRA